MGQVAPPIRRRTSGRLPELPSEDAEQPIVSRGRQNEIFTTPPGEHSSSAINVPRGRKRSQAANAWTLTTTGDAVDVPLWQIGLVLFLVSVLFAITSSMWLRWIPEFGLARRFADPTPLVTENNPGCLRDPYLDSVYDPIWEGQEDEDEDGSYDDDYD